MDKSKVYAELPEGVGDYRHGGDLYTEVQMRAALRNIAMRTQQVGGVSAVEREQERIAFKDAHRHLELDEVPDAWGRPMFKHSHVEASWLGWIAHAARARLEGKQ